MIYLLGATSRNGILRTLRPAAAFLRSQGSVKVKAAFRLRSQLFGRRFLNAQRGSLHQTSKSYAKGLLRKPVAKGGAIATAFCKTKCRDLASSALACPKVRLRNTLSSHIRGLRFLAEQCGDLASAQNRSWLHRRWRGLILRIARTRCSVGIGNRDAAMCYVANLIPTLT